MTVVVGWLKAEAASATLPKSAKRNTSFCKFGLCKFWLHNFSLHNFSLHKSSQRQQTAANASRAMRIRNIGMLLNPSPCQFAAAVQHDHVIRRAHDLFAALACFLGGSNSRRVLS